MDETKGTGTEEKERERERERGGEGEREGETGMFNTNETVSFNNAAKLTLKPRDNRGETSNQLRVYSPRRLVAPHKENERADGMQTQERAIK